jgi:hypothetical protein
MNMNEFQITYLAYNMARIIKAYFVSVKPF